MLSRIRIITGSVAGTAVFAILAGAVFDAGLTGLAFGFGTVSCLSCSISFFGYLSTDG